MYNYDREVNKFTIVISHEIRKKSVDKLFDKGNNVIEGENTKRVLINDYLFVL